MLHLQDVKDVSFGFQTVTSDVSKLSSFFALKMVKRLFVDKSLSPTTVSTAEKNLNCLANVLRHYGVRLQSHSE